jgi:hypothetical protein
MMVLVVRPVWVSVRAPAYNDRFDATLANSFLHFAQNGAQEIAIWGRLFAGPRWNRGRLVIRGRRRLLARAYRRVS